MEGTKVTTKVMFENWVNQFSDQLFSWAFHKTSSKETAEDLVQDTFVSAYHKIDSFQGKSQPKTWLFSILNNKIIDHYRKKSKQFVISADDYTQQIKTTDGFFDEHDKWKKEADLNEQHWLDNPAFNSILLGCIKNLPENWQFIIQSKYILDKKSADVCQELQITMSNYWQISHRAKLLLKKCIELNWVIG
jgi:RNA polymerase sigma-70 factor (ECF subfamily)